MKKREKFPSRSLNDERDGEKTEITEALINGYREYGSFNKAYAEMCLEADNECLASCEEKLSESE